jgi:haloacetate dehalogenase
MNFGDYEPFCIPTTSIETTGVKGGEGPPILLLHGHPQTHEIWRACADELARHFTVIATNTQRANAADQVDVMRHFGFARFLVCAHDGGAQVAHRMAMDFPEAIDRMMLLDSVPLLATHEETDSADLQDERADMERGRKIACPLRVLWGEQSAIGQRFDVLAEWRKLARDVSGRALPVSHDIPAEAPALLLEEIHLFFNSEAR